MTNLKVTIEVIENKGDRDNLVERVEVLDRVKELLLLPEMEMATSAQVADFYEVDYDAIKKLTFRNKEELISDGYITNSGKEIADFLRDKMSLKKIEAKKGKYVITMKDNSEYNFANRSNALFPKRAILRVGMLLRDSEVAKEVRTQLLNIEENSTQEVKTQEIDKEMTLEMNIGRAISKGDYVAVAIAVKELEDYKNRHTIEKAEKFDNYLDTDGSLTVTQVVDKLRELGEKPTYIRSAQSLNRFLREEGIQYKRGNSWYVYQRYEYLVEEGYVVNRQVLRNDGEYTNQLRWTPKGVDFIISLF